MPATQTTLTRQAALTRKRVAYDLSRFDSRRRVQEQWEAELAEKQKTRKRERLRAAAIARPRVSVWGVTGFVVGMFLMFMIVFSQMRLAEMGAQAGRLNREISQLTRENTRLAAEWENQVKLTDIRRLATERLGMVTPVADQILYIDLSGKDHAVATPREEKDFFTRLFGG